MRLLACSRRRHPQSAQPREWTGTSSTLTRDTKLDTSVASFGSGLLSTGFPFVTVEEVGSYRYWSEEEDGLPVKQFLPPTVAECANRGLCNRVRSGGSRVNVVRTLVVVLHSFVEG